jgi:hypothetical protein
MPSSHKTSESGWSLQITEADHEANEFRCLGGATWDTKAERDAAFDAIPASTTADSSVDDFSWMVDVLDEDGFSIVADREVDEHVVLGLLGDSSIEALRERAIERETVGRAVGEAFVEALHG